MDIARLIGTFSRLVLSAKVNILNIRGQTNPHPISFCTATRFPLG